MDAAVSVHALKKYDGGRPGLLYIYMGVIVQLLVCMRMVYSVRVLGSPIVYMKFIWVVQ